MSNAVAAAINLEVVACASCSMPFGMSADFVGRRRKDGEQFYCPAGHPNVYNKATSEAEKLRAENERLQQRLEIERRTHATEIRGARIKAGKAEAKARRAETRAHAGVCLHCNRTFKQLAAHMKTKHAGIA